MAHNIDFSRRAQLTELMDEPCTRDELRACLCDLARVNRWLLGYRPTLHWLESLRLERSAQPIRILDVGCGYGDTLRRIERWARARQISVELAGLDLNPDATAIAAEASGPGSAIDPRRCAIQWITGDVFSYSAPCPVHLVISSLFTHHLADADVVRFLGWMERTASIGWFINDLSRAPVPYHLFRGFSRVLRLHQFVQHDGPVSIARAFQPQDWRTLCAASGLPNDAYQVLSYKPARLCVARSKTRSNIP